MCEPGETGELYVSGPSVMTGYQAMADATAHALVSRGERSEGALWYRTGDLVHHTMNDGLIFHGRADRQVKIRGHRIELQEIGISAQHMVGQFNRRRHAVHYTTRQRDIIDGRTGHATA